MKPPRILSVQALPPHRLVIEWSTGETAEVGILEPIKRFRALRPLQDPARFAQATGGLWGHSVEWPGGLDLGADDLYARWKEQTGDQVPLAEFTDWITRNDLTLSAAARALGLSRRTVAYYCSGSPPISRLVGLACKGWEAAQRAA
ncbi:MAG: DUF2442 domain-containing protein [Deferrisomatales bacterium]